ncbi:MAG: class I SAM-dependent methyltransferase [Thermodesulfobacteriota bacterium]|nr:class I SAM-dependent methyltransferase [Thermodesulfobacteriota bacterium]
MRLDNIVRSLLYRFSRKYLLNKFDFWEKLGIHISQVSYYSPIPKLAKLRKKVDSFDKPIEMVGFDWNEGTQIRLMQDIFPQYSHECKFAQNENDTTNEWDYFIDNSSFPVGDAFILHSMIKHFKPKKIFEVGSGFSTLVMAKAITSPQELVSINPFPGEFESLFKTGFPGFKRLIKKPVEDINLDFFDELEANDILFIDSSHVVRPIGDVVFLYLEVIPRLKQGVIIHSHDIFLPGHIPKDWIFEQHRFWTEQYLLWALLSFNTEFEILFSAQYMKKYIEELQSIFPGYWAGGSFWFRKRNG